MAKFTTVGYVAQKKDKPGEVYFKVSSDCNLKKGQFLNINKKPTNDDIANSKSERQAEALTKKMENWADWKLSELVLVENDAE